MYCNSCILHAAMPVARGCKHLPACSMHVNVEYMNVLQGAQQQGRLAILQNKPAFLRTRSGAFSQISPAVCRPSAPSSFTPQVHTVPSSARAAECMPPATTCSTCADGIPGVAVVMGPKRHDVNAAAAGLHDQAWSAKAARNAHRDGQLGNLDADAVRLMPTHRTLTAPAVTQGLGAAPPEAAHLLAGDVQRERPLALRDVLAKTQLTAVTRAMDENLRRHLCTRS